MCLGRTRGTPEVMLCSRPTSTGWLGSPPKKSTITSCPTRGTSIQPKPAPAHCWLTRSQQLALSSKSFSRSQWKRTRTRPNSSVWISLPGGPTTIAVS